MKMIAKVIALMMVLSSVSFANEVAPVERDVQIGISGVFVPGGFDSNSDVYVVVNGIFQNGCYKWKRADVVNKDDFNHTVKSIASVSEGMCIMVLIPFQKEVRLGKFAPGKHNLRFENGDGTYLEKSVNIE